jgi:hypothetical protein
MSIIESLRETKEDVKAWGRGERRVAPAGVRGRVYAPKAGSVAAEGQFNSRAMGARAKLTATAVVHRAGGGTEHYKLIDGQAVRYYPGEGVTGWFKSAKARLAAFFNRT